MTHVTQTLIQRREYRSFHDLNHARLGVRHGQTHDLQMQQGMPTEPPTQTHQTETLMETILKAIHMAHHEAVLTALQVCASPGHAEQELCTHTAQHLAALQVKNAILQQAKFNKPATNALPINTVVYLECSSTPPQMQLI